MALGERRLGMAWRSTEEVVELERRHRKPRCVVEAALGEPERVAPFGIDNVIEDLVGVSWVSVRGKAHDLVLARINFEAGVVSEGRIEQPDTVGPVNLFQRFQRVTAA